MEKDLRSCAGVTLAEMLTAMAIATFFLSAILIAFMDSGRSYSVQEQVSDMNQNARYALKEISETLMEAGADLPLADVIITSADPDDFSVKVNPRGGYHIYDALVLAIQNLPVNNAKKFKDAVILRKKSASGAASNITIDTSYTSGTFVNGIDTTNNLVRVNPAAAMAVGDSIFAQRTRRFYLSGGNLCQDTDALVYAENIDSLAIVFLKSDGTTATTTWSEMTFARITVRAKTGLPDSKYTEYPDHRRRVTMSNMIQFKNKIGG